MSSKLQELTDKLYLEGLSKGKEEGEKILAQAQAQSAAIVKEAKEEAEKIVADASKKADDLAKKVESDLKMASAQCLQASKKDIENLVIAKISDEKVAKELKNADFVKETIKAVAEKFSAEQACELSVILPASLQAELEPWIRKELSAALGKEVEAEFSKKVSGGFKIGPKDGSYFVSLTDETFKALIAEYLRPVTRKILFGE